MTNNISTPIYDFVQAYAEGNESRFHMPGHKGCSFLGFEQFDITEVSGADSLYEAKGIIKESEQNATRIFGTASTCFATGGSSQCIAAMMYLALLTYKENHKCVDKPIVVAARNAHKSLIHVASLLDFDIIWLWPETNSDSICSCPISPFQLESVLKTNKDRVMAVYLTTPDYLGGIQDVRTIANICHNYDTLLTIDNAHGAYLHFLETAIHPMDLGADICADSAHKTLPVLTGGAYLHISKNAPVFVAKQAKYALSLFGSTSPSYLIMASLDLCNAYVMNDYQNRLKEVIDKIERCKDTLIHSGWNVLKTEPLKLVLEIPADYQNIIVEKLSTNHIMWEYLDTDYIVFMFTPENSDFDFERIVSALGVNEGNYLEKDIPVISKTTQGMSIRNAMLSNGETIEVANAIGRICRVPTVSCPPAIPIAVPGELITLEMIEVFRHYGVTQIDVVKMNGV